MFVALYSAPARILPSPHLSPGSSQDEPTSGRKVHEPLPVESFSTYGHDFYQQHPDLHPLSSPSETEPGPPSEAGGEDTSLSSLVTATQAERPTAVAPAAGAGEEPLKGRVSNESLSRPTSLRSSSATLGPVEASGTGQDQTANPANPPSQESSSGLPPGEPSRNPAAPDGRRLSEADLLQIHDAMRHVNTATFPGNKLLRLRRTIEAILGGYEFIEGEIPLHQYIPGYLNDPMEAWCAFHNRPWNECMAGVGPQ